MSDRTVKGYCPMGCGPSLFRAPSGHITCSYVECPNPSAASDVLADPEVEHVVEFKEDAFYVLHPLRERLEGWLFDCPVHRQISDLSGPPVEPGRYRRYDDGRYVAVLG